MPYYPPGGGGNIGVATGTSLALGGATIGSNALAVTGPISLTGAASTETLGFVYNTVVASTYTILSTKTGGGTQRDIEIGGDGSGTADFYVRAGGTRRMKIAGLDGATAFSYPTTVMSATAMPAGGITGSGLKFSLTSNFGIFFGSGAPTLSAAKGSLYLRSDGSGITDRAYINTDGGTTWTNLVTAV